MAVVGAMLESLTKQVFTALQEHARFALDFKDQFELMKTRLDLTKALLADTENLKEKKKVVKAILIRLRDLIYEADNIMTDCLVRDEYQKEASCTSLTLKKPLFWYQTGKKLKDVNAQLGEMEKSLGEHLKYQDQSDHGDNTSQSMKCGVRALSGLLAGMKRRWMSGQGYVLTRAKSESEKDDREEKLFKVAILK